MFTTLNFKKNAKIFVSVNMQAKIFDNIIGFHHHICKFAMTLYSADYFSFTFE